MPRPEPIAEVPTMEPLTRETLTGWQAGVLDDESLTAYWLEPCFPEQMVISKAKELIADHDLCRRVIATATSDPHYRNFDQRVDTVLPGMVDEYIVEFGEPEVEVMPDLDDAMGILGRSVDPTTGQPFDKDFALQAAIGRGNWLVGGLRAKLTYGGLTIWTPATHRTNLAAQVQAIAAWHALDEMFGDRRPEMAEVSFGGETEVGEVKVEIVRGPEVRVYYLEPWLTKVIEQILGPR
jgi:hypothetical protein